MKYLQYTFAAFLGFFLLFSTGCKKDKFEAIFHDKPIFGGNTGTSQSTSIVGRITDVNDQPLEGVTVTVDGQSTLTDGNGVYHLFKIEANSERTLVTFKKNGYFDGSKAIKPSINAVNRVDSKLLLRAQIGVVYNGLGGALTTGFGVQIQFEPGDVARPDGSAYSGEVQVYLAYIDPTNPMMLETMPGDLQAINSSSEIVFLKSFGMVIVELADDLGNELNVAPGRTVGIDFPIQAAQLDAAPATIPLWYFDDDLGYWKEEGEATNTGGNYHAEVAHFTPWNCDYPLPDPTIEIKGFLHFTNGDPVSFSSIVVEDGVWWIAMSNTDGNGYFEFNIPSNQLFTLKYYDGCGNVMHTGSFISSVDHDFGVIEVPFGSGSNLSATVNLCGESEGNYYVEYWNSSVFSGFFASIPIGYYERFIKHCNGENLSMRIYNLDNDGFSDIYTFPTTSDVDLGTIYLCDFGPGDEVEFVQTFLDGVESFVADSSGTSINFGFPFVETPDSAMLVGQNSTSNQIYLAISNFTGLGSYTNCKVLSYNDASYTGNINFTCTRYDSVGGYVEGTFGGTIYDESVIGHTINGSFRSSRTN